MLTLRWVRWLAVVLAAWNAIGIASYLAHVGMFGPDNAGEPLPVAITAAYATGVFAGTAGAIGLALMRPWAPTLVWLSLVAVVINWSWVFVNRNDDELALGLTVLASASILAALAAFARRQGWLAT